VEKYIDKIRIFSQQKRQSLLSPLSKSPAAAHPDWKIPAANRLPTADRFLVCEIDDTLLGDHEALHKLIERIRSEENHIGVGIATGRTLKSALEMLEEWRFPMPDLLITSAGSEIYYGPQIVTDTSWQKHIAYHWQAKAIRQVMKDIPGVELQAPESQGKFKISYFVDESKAPKFREIIRHLRRHQLSVKGVYSHNMYLDLVPIRASKGDAIRYVAWKWGLPVQRFLVAGASGNDETMLSGSTLAVVVGNYSQEIEKLRGHSQVYFAEGHYAWGILEALDHYDFFGNLSQKQLELAKV
jgi:sucrose-phosphate synthase